MVLFIDFPYVGFHSSVPPGTAAPSLPPFPRSSPKTSPLLACNTVSSVQGGRRQQLQQLPSKAWGGTPRNQALISGYHDLMFGSSAAKLQMSVINSWLCGVLIGRKKNKNSHRNHNINQQHLDLSIRYGNAIITIIKHPESSSANHGDYHHQPSPWSVMIMQPWFTHRHSPTSTNHQATNINHQSTMVIINHYQKK